jgi:hypothetical protein
MSDAQVKFFADDKRPADPGAEVFFAFTCPRGRGSCGFLPILGRTSMRHDPQNKNGGTAHWTWDGDRDAPTFSPSINCGGCWHGYIKRGRCVDA